MVTELLGRTTVELLEDVGIPYTAADDHELSFILPTNDARVQIQIIDHESELPMVSIKMPEFVRFPEERRDSAVAMCNYLSGRAAGKFLVEDCRGYVSYTLDCPIREDAGPDGFKHALTLAMFWFTKMYPAIMRARWAGSNVEDELEPPDESESGGAPDSDILTDEEINRMLRESGADADGE